MTEEPPDLTHLWAAVGATPEDSLPRLVLADWLDEREGAAAECGRCGGQGDLRSADGRWWPGQECPACDGAGRVSNGFAELAAALRATAGACPLSDGKVASGRCGWFRGANAVHPQSNLRPELFDRLPSGALVRGGVCREYPTAESAIRSLCRAHVAVHGGKA